MLDEQLTQIQTLIANLEDSVASQEQGVDGAARSSTDLRAFEEGKPANQTDADDM